MHFVAGTVMYSISKWLIIVGVLVVVLGILLLLFGHKLQWLGHLPGDIRIEKERFRFYFPLTTMILLSVILTLILRILKKII